VSRTAWTTKELQALRAGWAEGLRGQELANHIAEATGLPVRGAISVASAANRDGLKAGRSRAWSQEEKDLLVDLRLKRMSFDLIAAEFFARGWGDRSPEAIRLALARSGRRPKGLRHPLTDWTEGERKKLSRLRRKGLTWAEVASAMSAGGKERTAAACKAHAFKRRRRRTAC